MSKPWFGAKTYGIGVGPKSPAGWIALAVFVGLVVAVPAVAAHFAAPAWAPGVAIGGLTIGFVILILAKSDGRPWRWRWGGR